MPYRIRTTYALVALSVALCGLAADAEDWPHWRGPNYDGMSTETGFKTQWDGTPPIVWQREIGSGFSAITSHKASVSQRTFGPISFSITH